MRMNTITFFTGLGELLRDGAEDAADATGLVASGAE
jgi:hypothetical protein